VSCGRVISLCFKDSELYPEQGNFKKVSKVINDWERDENYKCTAEMGT
jgi:hypothetical protein